MSLSDLVSLIVVASAISTMCSAATDPEDTRKINPDLIRDPSIGPCSDDTWGYSNITGSCYMFKENKDPVGWWDAENACTSLGDGTKLLFIEDEREQIFIDEQLLRFNYVPHWIAAKRDGSSDSFKWKHDNSEVTYARWDTDEPDPSGDCVFIYRPSGFDEWRWKTSPCAATKDVYCKKDALQCPPIPTAAFLEPSFPKPNIEQNITFSCMAGYMMPDYKTRYTTWQSDSAANRTNATEPYWKTNPSLNMYCDYSGQWDNTTDAVAPCEPLSCEAVPTVKYAKANDSVTRIYPTWTEFKCNHGYYYKDINSRFKTGRCGSDVRWHDVPRECDPVPCPPFDQPGNSTTNNDHLTFFGDVIAYKCISGYMFPDGAVWKFVACRQNYVNELIGRWNETEFDPCERLKCPAPPTGSNIIQIGSSTEHRARINYTCYDGYEFPDSSTSVILECSDDAVWKPNLPKCNEKPVPLPTTGKKYQPPTVDAPGASSIGSTSMVICIIMLIVLVLLDITTISRDIKLLKSNLKHFRRRLAGKKPHTN